MRFIRIQTQFRNKPKPKKTRPHHRRHRKMKNSSSYLLYSHNVNENYIEIFYFSRFWATIVSPFQGERHKKKYEKCFFREIFHFQCLLTLKLNITPSLPSCHTINFLLFNLIPTWAREITKGTRLNNYVCWKMCILMAVDVSISAQDEAGKFLFTSIHHRQASRSMEIRLRGKINFIKVWFH